MIYSAKIEVPAQKPFDADFVEQELLKTGKILRWAIVDEKDGKFVIDAAIEKVNKLKKPQVPGVYPDKS